MGMNGQLDSLPDETLVRMSQAGERAAFDALCSRYLNPVYNRLRALLPPEAVEDVTQEVFLAAMRGIKRYRGQSSFRTWLAALVRHKTADYYRRRSRRPDTVEFDEEINNPTGRDVWEEHTLIRIALRRLPSSYQEVLLLRFAEGMHFKDIAVTLNISLEAAKSRYRRAFAALRLEINEP